MLAIVMRHLKRGSRALGFATAAILASAAQSTSPECDEAAVTAASIWCDSFESADYDQSYFDYSPRGGRLERTQAESVDGTWSLAQRFSVGDVSAGWITKSFGRNPLAEGARPDEDFRSVYWRLYVRYSSGPPFSDKLSRIMVFADSRRAQAMIGHVWMHATTKDRLIIDPASGTTPEGQLVSTGWNDFEHLSWLGNVSTPAALEADRWYCVEAAVELNDAGFNNGNFRLWIDEELVASRTDLNWLGDFDEYGLNTVMLSGYWNGGAIINQVKYVDAFRIATEKIGCRDGNVPKPPVIEE